MADGVVDRKRHRRWPWVVLAVVIILLVLAWLAVGAVGDDYIANHGKDAAPVGVCPFTNCRTVTYSGHLAAWYAPPSGSAPTLIMVHGYGANRTDHSQALGQFQSQYGFGLMAIDLGYETDAQKYGGGTKEANEVVSAITYAHQQSSNPIVLLGYSAGGTEAILAAGKSSLVSAVVADSSPVSFIHLATDQTGVPTWVLSAGPLLYGMFSSGGSLGSLSSLPSSYHVATLVIQGTADHTVTYSNGPAVANLTHGKLWTIHGGTHTSAFSMCPSQYITQLHSFYADAIAGNSASFALDQACA